MIMNNETFIYALQILHDAFHNITLPDDEDEEVYLDGLLQCYLVMIANFDRDKINIISDYLVQYPVYDKEQARLLYAYLFLDEGYTIKN